MNFGPDLPPSADAPTPLCGRSLSVKHPVRWWPTPLLGFEGWSRGLTGPRRDKQALLLYQRSHHTAHGSFQLGSGWPAKPTILKPGMAAV
jgi:hypothetical protein